MLGLQTYDYRTVRGGCRCTLFSSHPPTSRAGGAGKTASCSGGCGHRMSVHTYAPRTVLVRVLVPPTYSTVHDGGSKRNVWYDENPDRHRLLRILRPAFIRPSSSWIFVLGSNDDGRPSLGTGGVSARLPSSDINIFSSSPQAGLYGYGRSSVVVSVDVDAARPALPGLVRIGLGSGWRMMRLLFPRPLPIFLAPTMTGDG